MSPEEYAARQALITAATANFVYQFGQFWARQALSITEWLKLLQFLFPEIRARRSEAALLAREFYDSQRLLSHPDLSLNQTPLVGSDFTTFVKSMDPARKRMQQADSPRDAVTLLTLRAVREVENAGRRQIISAVKEDPELDQKILDYKGQPVKTQSGLIRGWARVATGRETCAWCLMLISRGPVYYEPGTAGLDLDPESAAEMIAAGEDVSDYMEEWHAGCDCKVVPVFKNEDWAGQAAADAALELWKDATKEARQVLADDPDKVHKFGEKKGEPVTLNEEAINALRRRLERGDISMTEFAALAA